MPARNYRRESHIESWSNFDCVDSFGSLGRAVVGSMIDKITGPAVFTTEIATRGLKLAIQQIRTY